MRVLMKRSDIQFLLSKRVNMAWYTIKTQILCLPLHVFYSIFLVVYLVLMLLDMKQYIIWIHKAGYSPRLHVSTYFEKLKQRIILKETHMCAIQLISGLQKPVSLPIIKTGTESNRTYWIMWQYKKHVKAKQQIREEKKLLDMKKSGQLISWQHPHLH